MFMYLIKDSTTNQFVTINLNGLITYATFPTKEEADYFAKTLGLTNYEIIKLVIPSENESEDSILLIIESYNWEQDIDVLRQYKTEFFLHRIKNSDVYIIVAKIPFDSICEITKQIESNDERSFWYVLPLEYSTIQADGETVSFEDLLRLNPIQLDLGLGVTYELD